MINLRKVVDLSKRPYVKLAKVNGRVDLIKDRPRVSLAK